MKTIRGFAGAIVAALILSGPVIATHSASNRTNEQVLKVERLLSDLGYWIVKVDGVADSSTRHAITAFQKVEGLKRTGLISQGLVVSLQQASRPAARHNTGQRHLEIDLSRQVLFMVDEGGSVDRILPVSTGTERP